MGTRRLKITGIHPGVVKGSGAANLLPTEKMDEIHIFFSRPLSGLEFAGIQAAVERAVK